MLNNQLSHRITAQKTWYKFHLDAHIPPDEPMMSDDFSVEEFVRKVIDTGADSFCIFAKCHYGYSYYPTKIGHVHPQLKLDLMGSLAKEFKKQAPELPLFVYYNLRFSPVDAKIHPEWLIQGMGKDAQEGKGHLSMWQCYMCFNSGYRDTVFGQTEEITKKYPVDGFFLDFSRSVGVCYCNGCRSKYKKETGKEIPLSNDASDYLEYCKWQRTDSDRFVNELAVFLQKIKSHISLCSNHCYGIRQPLPLPRSIGYISEDVEERLQTRGCLESMHARYYCSLDVPVEIMTSRFTHWWTDWGFKTDDELFLQNAVISALGLRIDLADELYPNYKIPDRVLSLFKNIIQRAKFIRKLMDGARSRPEILILHSASTYYAQERAANDSLELLNSLYGIHNILVQSGFHYQFVNEYDLHRWLTDVKMLILPDQNKIEDETQDRIREFVQSGGIVITTGGTALNEGLKDVFGVTVRGEWDTPHQYLMSKPFTSYEGKDFPVMVRGRSFKLKPETAKEVSSLQEGLFSSEGFCDGHPIGERQFAGITENSFGKGKAVVTAVSVGRSMKTHPYPALKHLFLSIVRTYHPSPFVKAKNSSLVEITHFQKGVQSLVHLIHHPIHIMVDTPYVIDNIEPIENFQISFNLEKKPTSVYIEDHGNVPDWSFEDRTLTVRIKNLHIHTVLIIEKG